MGRRVRRPAGEPVRRRPGPTTYEKETLLAAKRQAWSTIIGAALTALALVVSAAALYVSAVAWRGQRSLNEQQAQLNRYAADRERSLYSSRVAIWASIGVTSSSVLPEGLDVHVQNRAPVPLHTVRILAPLASGAVAQARLGELPPCVVRSLRIGSPPDDPFARGTEAWLGYAGLRLEFGETGRTWLLSGTGLTLVPAAGPEDLRQLKAAAPRQEAVGDCGEGA